MIMSSLLIDILLLSTAWSHVLLTPFTKVEESFNLHATHDVLIYGVDASNITKFDHFVFPGAVPRSFLGSILLAWSSLPVIHLLKSTGFVTSKADLQIIVRLVLATGNAIGLCILRRAVQKRFGFSTGVFFALLSCSQFHLPFWMGRTLPNMFALFPVTIAYALILFRQPNSIRPAPSSILTAIALLTFTAVVFRAEVLLLLAPLSLHALLARWVSFRSVVKTGIVAAGASILLTTVLDTYLWSHPWSRPLWPEAYSIYFNIYQNKSSEWGVSPFHAYFSSHLPKLLLTSLPLSALGFLAEPRVRGILIQVLILVLGMSLLGHKEWRFIVYVVPIFNVAAARGAYWLSRQRTRSIIGRLALLTVLGCIAANLLVTIIMTQVSMSNYPGGVALSRFNKLFADSSQNVHVHISNLAAQTGASLFLQTHAPPYPPFFSSPASQDWIYNKTENLTPQDITSLRHFTHAIVETDQLTEFLEEGEWNVVECVKGFDAFRVIRDVLGKESESGGNDAEGGIWESVPRLRVVYSDKLCILSRR